MKLGKDLVAASATPLIGVQCVAKILKTEMKDPYSVSVRSHNQIPLIASLIDEPAADSNIVPLLSALPPKEIDFYEAEQNVVDWCGRSQQIFEEV